MPKTKRQVKTYALHDAPAVPDEVPEDAIMGAGFRLVFCLAADAVIAAGVWPVYRDSRPDGGWIPLWAWECCVAAGAAASGARLPREALQDPDGDACLRLRALYALGNGP